MKAEVWPDAANADELHDALVWLGFLTDAEVEANAGWRDWLADLGKPEARGADRARRTPAVWIAAERLSLFRALWPDLATEPADRRAGGLSTSPRRATRRWSRSCAAGSKVWGR